MLRKFKTAARDFIWFVAGKPASSTLENRIFSSIALISGISNALGSLNYTSGLTLYAENFQKFIHFVLNLGCGPEPCADNLITFILFVLHLGCGLLLLIMYFISRLKGEYRSLFWPFILSIFIFLFVNVLVNAGSLGGAHYYLITAAMIAVILAPNHFSTVLCFLLGIAAASVLFWIEYQYPEKIISFASREERFQDFPGAFIFMLLFNGALVLILRMQFSDERDKSERLLLNILPQKVAEELKASEHVVPVNYENASVLFTDIVGFTHFAEKLSPQELVERLDYNFRSFDTIAYKYNMEKIKTIGDAYMTVGGVPEPNNTHPVDAILTAIEMKQHMRVAGELNEKQNTESWQLRIGIHTGHLVAGVIGEKKFAYDVWGDAVNIASRMESSSEPGKINISAYTHQLVKKFFQCAYRGEVAAKNKGKIEMYFVERLHAPYSQDLDGYIPNETFWKAYKQM